MKKRESLLLITIILSCVLLLSGCGMTQEKAITELNESFILEIQNYEKKSYEKYIDKVKGFDVGDTVYNLYMGYLFECYENPTPAGYPDFGRLTNSDRVEIIEIILNAIELEDEQYDKLYEVQNNFQRIVDLDYAYLKSNLPEKFQKDELNFDYNNTGVNLSAYALYDVTEFGGIDGYNLILFTDFVYDFYWGHYPNYKKYYYVYMPDSTQLYFDAWNLQGLCYVGTRVYHGQFDYNAPVYILLNETDALAVNNYLNANLIENNCYENIEDIVNEEVTLSGQYNVNIDQVGTITLNGYSYETIAFGYISSDNVSVMIGPGYDAQSAGVLNTGDKIYILDEEDDEKTEGWSWVINNELIGYVESKYIASEPLVDKDSTKLEVTNEVDYNIWVPWDEIIASDPGRVIINEGKLNVRSGPGEKYEIIATLENGAELNIITEYDGWSQVIKGNIQGFVASQYISQSELEQIPEKKKEKETLSRDVKNHYVSEYIKNVTWTDVSNSNITWTFEGGGIPDFSIDRGDEFILGEYGFFDTGIKNEIGLSLLIYTTMCDGPYGAFTNEFFAWLDESGIQMEQRLDNLDQVVYNATLIIEEPKIMIQFSENAIIELYNPNPSEGWGYKGN